MKKDQTTQATAGFALRRVNADISKGTYSTAIAVKRFC